MYANNVYKQHLVSETATAVTATTFEIRVIYFLHHRFAEFYVYAENAHISCFYIPQWCWNTGDWNKLCYTRTNENLLYTLKHLQSHSYFHLSQITYLLLSWYWLKWSILLSLPFNIDTKRKHLINGHCARYFFFRFIKRTILFRQTRHNEFCVLPKGKR